MNQPLWTKADVAVDARLMQFMAGEDCVLDRHLFRFDIRATIAHVRGLNTIGLLTDVEREMLTSHLNQLESEFSAGDFILDDRFEDGHTAIESYLVQQLGELGKRVHLGRSRNDQVLTATRLYMKDRLASLARACLDAANASLNRAEEHRETVMPGYTHMQRAVPSSVGLWYASYIEAFIEHARQIHQTIKSIDACPLGTAAGYGVNLPLPREQVAKELGFARILVNPMYAQATRGPHEVQAIAAMWQVAQTLRRLGWDLVLFSSTEFGFVQLPQEATTGSSIMPNKANPDVAELLRGIAPKVGGALIELLQCLSLPSGYHRDLQNTKGPLIRSVLAVEAAMEFIPSLLESLHFNASRMDSAIDSGMFATDRAVDLAASGMPFRDAYRLVAEELDAHTEHDALDSIRKRISPGAPGNLLLDELRRRMQHAADLLN